MRQWWPNYDVDRLHATVGVNETNSGPAPAVCGTCYVYNPKSNLTSVHWTARKLERAKTAPKCKTCLRMVGE